MSKVKFINRENLIIARENMGLRSFEVSKQISSSKTDIVSLWESGEALPNWSQITKLSKIYNISELLFFSETRIGKNKVIPDYRVGASKKSDEKVNKLINLVVTRQKWLEKKLKDEGSSKNPLQGSGKGIQNPKALADFISQKLSISLDKIKSISGTGSRKEALNYLIQCAENQGIFVGKTISYHKLDVKDLRGLFISNDYSPFIVLNRKDAVSAQIFSFIHELAHLFRKSDAISNSLDFRNTDTNVSPEEIFCNKVAAELLLPKNEFVKEYYDKTDISNLSELYKVSQIFIFYRLKELGKIRNDKQASIEAEIETEMARNLLLKANREKIKKGGNYTNSMRDSNGSLFNRIVGKTYLENGIGYVEASNLLRFSAEKI